MDSRRPLYQRLNSQIAVNMRPTIAGSHIDPRTGRPFTGVFTGELLLWNQLGTNWNDFAQAGALVLTPSAQYSEVLGIDRVKITADGNTITLDPAFTWRNVGSTAISTTPGAINILYVMKASATELEYSVKVF